MILSETKIPTYYFYKTRTLSKLNNQIVTLARRDFELRNITFKF